MTDVTPTDIENHISVPALVTMIHNNVTVDAVGKTVPIHIGNSTVVELLVNITGETGTATIQYHINVIEEVSGKTVKTYDGTSLSAAGVDYILISGVTLGDYITVNWSTTGSLSGAHYFTGVTARLIAK